MSGFELMSYFVTLVTIAIAPGPVVLMLIVRAASNDIKGAVGFGIGFAMGGVAIITAVCFGMAAWLTAVPEIFEYSKYVLMAYLVWMARGIWKGGFDLNGHSTERRSTVAAAFGTGLMTCMISPYMMILFPLILPEMMNVTEIQMPGFLIICLTTFAALAAGAALVVVFAAQLRRIANSPRASRIMNRSLAVVLVGLGGGMALA